MVLDGVEGQREGMLDVGAVRRGRVGCRTCARRLALAWPYWELEEAGWKPVYGLGAGDRER
jgi:hypothetical protein